LKREIQIGHVITTLTVAVAAVMYVGKQDQRIAVIEQQMLAQRDRDDRQDTAIAEKTIQLGRQLERIEVKLDRVIERGAK
jgi:hypothetical protein